MRLLVVVYDVSGLSEEQEAGLVGEVIAQAEASEYHPDVPVAYEQLGEGEPASPAMLARVLGLLELP